MTLERTAPPSEPRSSTESTQRDSGNNRQAWLARAILVLGLPLALLPLANVWPKEQTLQIHLPIAIATPSDVEVTLLDGDREPVSVARYRVTDATEPLRARARLPAGEYQLIVTVGGGDSRDVFERRLDISGETTTVRLERPTQ